MKILVVVATDTESRLMDTSSLGADVLITGVGTAATVFHLSRKLMESSYDLVIQTGIAGSFDVSVPLGEAVLVKSDVFAGSGIREQGKFIPLFESPLQDKNAFPFEKGHLVNPRDLQPLGFRMVKAISVDTVTEDSNVIKEQRQIFNPDIESMEGAAFHYVCLMNNIPFIQLRSISNYVGDRNKANWRMEQAIGSLNDALIKIIGQMRKR